MELRHLRYFITVAEEGSLTTAAERRLHTSQPSPSRQIRDLEYQVGAELLLVRSVHGVELRQRRAKPFSTMRGWRSLKLLPRWKRHVGPHSRQDKPSRSAFKPVTRSTAVASYAGAARRVEEHPCHGDERLFAPDLVAEAPSVRGRLDVAFMRTEPNSELAATKWSTTSCRSS